MQPGQPYQPTVAPIPARMPRWLAWLIVGIVIIVMVGGVVAFVAIPYLAQPKVTLTAETYTMSNCMSYPSHFTFTWTFTLVNTGNANGFATVELYLNGQPGIGTYSTITYLVPQGSQVSEQPSLNSPDCGSYSPGAVITSVAKA